jgi:N-acetylmuramoyl-L-alanine amidase
MFSAENHCQTLVEPGTGISKRPRAQGLPGFVLGLLAVLIWGLGAPPCVMAAGQVLGLRHWVAPDHTRVVVDLSEDVPFSVEKGDGRLTVDIEQTLLPEAQPRSLVLNKPGVERINLAPRPAAGLRVELILPGDVQANVFKLKTFQDKPCRIVIDLVIPEVAKQESEAREQVKVAGKARVVVIDPGHGGDAPGAVGKKGTQEKDVVLSIARKVRDLLNGRAGYRTFLTRNDDYYVSFRKRLMIAREYGADLFVSIHADAARNRDAGGGSVYCLSTGGASNEAARILARNENLADVVGGVPNGEGNDADPIILDMFQTHNINQSRAFGAVVLRELGRANRLKFAAVQEAPFRVLKLPEIPSVLVETAYISNAREEKLLRSRDFQEQIAGALVSSIVSFLPPPPDREPALAGEKPEKSAAAKSPGGVKAKKPEPAASRAARPAAAYRVKKGDTLTAIAARHGTTVRELMALNRLKRPDPLYVGLKLVLPQPPP